MSTRQKNIAYIYIVNLSRKIPEQITKLGITTRPRERLKEYFPSTDGVVKSEFDYLYLISSTSDEFDIDMLRSFETLFMNRSKHFSRSAVCNKPNIARESRYCSPEELNNIFVEHVIPIIEMNCHFSVKLIKMDEIPNDNYINRLPKIEKPKTLDEEIPENLPELTLRQHQKETLDAYQNFDGSRCQIIAPTGSGKTFTSSLIAKGNNKIIFVIPNNCIFNQFYKYLRPRFMDHQFVILSSQFKPYKNDGNIHMNVDQNSLDIIVEHYEKVLIITTSQSCKKITKGVFDLAIFDEAHHQSGHDSSTRVLLHDTEDLKILMRVFQTATPRFQKSKDENVFCMSNNEKFGKIIHYLPFRTAVQRSICNDLEYQFIQTDDMKIKSNEAVVVTILDQFKNNNRRKMIVYAENNEYSRNYCGAFKNYCDTKNELKDVNVYIVSQDNKDDLEKFREDTGLAILFNCEIAIEGYDDAYVDCVYITYNIKSPERFVQIAGRATRIHNKKNVFSTIVMNSDDAQLCYKEAMINIMFTLNFYEGRYKYEADHRKSTDIINPNKIIAKIVGRNGTVENIDLDYDRVKNYLNELQYEYAGKYYSKSQSLRNYLKHTDQFHEDGCFLTACVRSKKNFKKLEAYDPLVWKNNGKTPGNSLSTLITAKWVEQGLLEKIELTQEEKEFYGKNCKYKFRFIESNA